MDEKFQSILDVIEEHARHRSENRAVTFLKNGETETGHLDWKQLHQFSLRASVEISSKTRKGDRVLILMSTGLGFPTAFLGCLHAGVIPVPTSLPNSPSEKSRTQQIVADCEPSLILCDNESLSETLELSVPAHQLSLKEDGGACGFAISPENLALIQYTSGSTRTPRGVKITHRNVSSNLAMHQAAFETGNDSVFVNWCPLFHDLGLITMMLHSFFVGGHLVLMSPASFLRKPIRWMEAVSKYRGTMIIAPNFGYDLLLQHSTKTTTDLDLSSLRIASNAAEPIQAKTLRTFEERFAGVGLLPKAVTCSYGLAEATVYASSSDVEQGPTVFRADRRVLESGSIQHAEDSCENICELAGVGAPGLSGKIRIVNPKTCRPLPDREVGEIWISGPHVSAGYWNATSSDGGVFCAEIEGESGQWLRSGDLGFISGGEIFVSGRLKETIIIRGRTFYPQDIEAAIVDGDFPEIRKRGVVAFGAEVNGAESLVILVEIGSAFKSGCDEIANQLRSRVAGKFHLEIHEIIFAARGTISRTTSGKLERNACRVRYLNDSIEYFSRSSTNERSNLFEVENSAAAMNLVGKLIASELGIPQIDPTKSLFRYGIDSIKFAGIVARLESELDQAIPYQRWAINPTVDRLTGLLKEEPRDVEAPTKFDRKSPSKTKFSRRLRRKLIEIGPTFAGRALLPHGLGTSIQRNLLRCRVIQHCFFGRQRQQLLALLDDAGASAEEAEKQIFRNLMANSWTIWRGIIFENQKNFERNVEILGEEHLVAGGPVVLACTHSGGLRTLITSYLKDKGHSFSIIGHLRESGLAESGLSELASEVAKKEVLPGLAIRSALFIAASACLQKRDGIVVIFADATMGRKGVTTPFFSIARTIRPGLAKLALDNAAAVVPVSVGFSENDNEKASFTLKFHPPLEGSKIGGSHAPEDSEILTQYGEHLQSNAIFNYGSLEGFLIERLFSQLPNHSEKEFSDHGRDG